MTAHIPRLAWGRADGWNGLADGQEWNMPPGGKWQARLDPEGRACVIGGSVAILEQNPDRDRGEHGRPARDPSRLYLRRRLLRRWHAGLNGYDRAMRAARLHNAMIKAASNG